MSPKDGIKKLIDDLVYGDAFKWAKLDEFAKDEWQPVLQELIRKSEDLAKIEAMLRNRLSEH